MSSRLRILGSSEELMQRYVATPTVIGSGTPYGYNKYGRMELS